MKLHLSLTSPDSHQIIREKGVGSFSIGTRKLSQGKYDALVDEEETIDWSCFNDHATPAESPWPRVFYYSGNDTGFINWSFKRPIEEFHWTIQKDLSVDLDGALIHHLYVNTGSHNLTLTIGSSIHKLHVSGDINKVMIDYRSGLPPIYLYPKVYENATLPYAVPAWPSLNKIDFLSITVPPTGHPFDCASLFQFPLLKNIELSGNVINLEALKSLKHLEWIVLRNIPDLSHMPALKSWDRLSGFIGWNIEAEKGKELQEELKVLQKEKTFKYASISKLRRKSWFQTEYGMPFSNWEPVPGKIATKAYKESLKKIRKAKSAGEVREAIYGMLAVINALPDTGTTEREDAAIAVQQLIGLSALSIDKRTVEEWFTQYNDI